MGRSVSYPSGAIVAFRLIGTDEDDDLDWEYECLVDWIRAEAIRAFPSLRELDGWRGREDRILLRNAYADCGISTYCGLAAVWLVERSDGAYWDADAATARSPRAQRWLGQVADKFSTLFGELECLGRFSNGEAIYRRRDVA